MAVRHNEAEQPPYLTTPIRSGTTKHKPFTMSIQSGLSFPNSFGRQSRNPPILLASHFSVRCHDILYTRARRSFTLGLKKPSTSEGEREGFLRGFAPQPISGAPLTSVKDVLALNTLVAPRLTSRLGLPGLGMRHATKPRVGDRGAWEWHGRKV